MQRKRVNSSKLRSVGYDEASQDAGSRDVERAGVPVRRRLSRGVPALHGGAQPTSFFDDKIEEEYTPKPVK
jgi:hypothetical protein